MIRCLVVIDVRFRFNIAQPILSINRFHEMNTKIHSEHFYQITLKAD